MDDLNLNPENPMRSLPPELQALFAQLPRMMDMSKNADATKFRMDFARDVLVFTLQCEGMYQGKNLADGPERYQAIEDAVSMADCFIERLNLGKQISSRHYQDMVKPREDAECPEPLIELEITGTANDLRGLNILFDQFPFSLKVSDGKDSILYHRADMHLKGEVLRRNDNERLNPLPSGPDDD